MMKKIKTQQDLARIVAEKKSLGKRIGFTNGCFDILHPGHVRYLDEASKSCDILIIGVNSDESVKRIKGQDRPFNAERARMEVLAGLESVDFLTIFEENTPEELIKDLGPDMLFKGGDWDEKDIAGASHVKAHGGEIRIIPYVGEYSTTKLIKKIKNKK